MALYEWRPRAGMDAYQAAGLRLLWLWIGRTELLTQRISRFGTSELQGKQV